MPEVYKRLAAATVGVTKTVVYTVPGSTSAIIKGMEVVALLATPQTITIWHNSGSTEVRMLNGMTIDGLGLGTWDGTKCLAAGDTISVQANIAAAFEFSMSGIEVT